MSRIQPVDGSEGATWGLPWRQMLRRGPRRVADSLQAKDEEVRAVRAEDSVSLSALADVCREAGGPREAVEFDETTGLIQIARDVNEFDQVGPLTPPADAMAAIPGNELTVCAVVLLVFVFAVFGFVAYVAG